MLKVLTNVLMLCGGILLSGCVTGVHNNHRTPMELAQHFVNSGIPIVQAQRLSPDPFMANEALAIMVDDVELGLYKYNTDTAVQKKRIERYGETGRAYILGIPYPIAVQGSFMLMGWEKSPKKKEILEAFRNFR